MQTFVNAVAVMEKAMIASRDINALLTEMAQALVQVAYERDQNASAARDRNERGNLLAKEMQKNDRLTEQLKKALISLGCVQLHDLDTPEKCAEHVKLVREWRDEILRDLGWHTGDDWYWHNTSDEEVD